jgi:hypothetical protein
MLQTMYSKCVRIKFFFVFELMCALPSLKISLSSKILDSSLSSKTLVSSGVSCEWSAEHIMQSTQHPVQLYWPSTRAYDQDIGHDMLSNTSLSGGISEKHPDLELELQQNLMKISSIEKVWSCVQQRSEGAHHKQRIGPFTSTGRSWMRFELQDIGRLSVALSKYPEGVSVTKSFVGPVDVHGDVMGTPPLFLHHAVVVPGRNSMKNLNLWKCIALGQERECTLDGRNSMLTAASDQQCSGEDDGEKCLGFHSPNGFGIHFDQPAGMLAELVDDRHWGSGPMQWYFEIRLDWVPAKSVKPLSSMMLCTAGRNLSPSLPKGYDVPILEESFTWSSFRAGFTGQVLAAQDHKHLFNGESLWFQADTADLGLNEMQFQRSKPWDNIFLPADVGMSSNNEVRQYIFRNLNASAIRALAMHKAPPAWRVQVHGHNEVIDGVSFPRSSSARLVTPSWHIKSDDHLVGIVFQPSREHQVPQHLLHEGGLSEHFFLYLMYEDPEGRYVNPQSQWGHFDPEKSWIFSSSSGVLAFGPAWEHMMLLMTDAVFPPVHVLSSMEKAEMYLRVVCRLAVQGIVFAPLLGCVLLMFIIYQLIEMKRKYV